MIILCFQARQQLIKIRQKHAQYQETVQSATQKVFQTQIGKVEAEVGMIYTFRSFTFWEFADSTTEQFLGSEPCFFAASHKNGIALPITYYLLLTYCTVCVNVFFINNVLLLFDVYSRSKQTVVWARKIRNYEFFRLKNVGIIKINFF